MSERPGPLKLAVLNPGGRDPEQYFDSLPSPDSKGHPPVNFHAFAACTEGSFHRKTKEAIAEHAPVLLLLRGDLRASYRALIECQKEKRTVVVSLKETGLHQFALQFSRPKALARLFEIMERANGCIATTPEMAAIYRQCRPRAEPRTVAFIPTPYPLEEPRWDFSVKPDRQSGLLVGTREWNVPSRNHLAALLMARKLCEATSDPVTVFNLDGRKGNRLLAALNFPAGKLHVIEERMSYPDYLRQLARHKIVLQLDRSRVPGQVAGDALLCRTICVGGDSAIEQIAFPKTCGVNRSVEEIGAIAKELLTSHNARGTAFMESQWRSMEQLSFEAVRKRLGEFFAQFG